MLHGPWQNWLDVGSSIQAVAYSVQVHGLMSINKYSAKCKTIVLKSLDYVARHDPMSSNINHRLLHRGLVFGSDVPTSGLQEGRLLGRLIG